MSRGRVVLVLAGATVLVAILGLVASEVQARNNFGAIAASGSGRSGWAVDRVSRAAAEGAALAQCGRGCEVKLWFKNTCGAYAQGRNAEGWAYADTRLAAERLALESCTSRGAGCRVLCWGCNAH